MNPHPCLITRRHRIVKMMTNEFSSLRTIIPWANREEPIADRTGFAVHEHPTTVQFVQPVCRPLILRYVVVEIVVSRADHQIGPFGDSTKIAGNLYNLLVDRLASALRQQVSSNHDSIELICPGIHPAKMAKIEMQVSDMENAHSSHNNRHFCQISDPFS